MTPERLLFESTLEPFGPLLTDELVSQAEATLRVKLPRSYIDILRTHNGGFLKRDTFMHPSFIPKCDYGSFVVIPYMLGIGGERGIETESPDIIEHYSYPTSTVVLFSDQYTAFLLDYRNINPDAEPPVIFYHYWPGEEGKEIFLAPNFSSFLEQLTTRNSRLP
jgi:hypothetical protein